MQVLIEGESARSRMRPPLLRLLIPAAGEAFPSVMQSHGMTVDARPYERAEEPACID